MLLTDWLVLGTAGETVDGRAIDEKWLKDAADTYSRDLYTANINVDHYRWYGNYGQVVELRLSKNERGEATLEGRLHPNHYLIQLNKDGQKLFVSMELTPNFRGTGKAYLTGLAVTDQPASAGTSQLSFNRQNSDFMYTAMAELNLQLPTEQQKNTDQEASIISRFVAALQSMGAGSGSQKQFSTSEPEQKDETEMTEAQFNELKNLLAEQTQSLSDVTKGLTGLVEKLTSDQGEGQGDSGNGDSSGDENPSVQELKEQVEKLSAVVDGLKKEVPAKYKSGDHDGDNQSQPEFV